MARKSSLLSTKCCLSVRSLCVPQLASRANSGSSTTVAQSSVGMIQHCTFRFSNVKLAHTSILRSSSDGHFLFWLCFLEKTFVRRVGVVESVAIHNMNVGGDVVNREMHQRCQISQNSSGDLSVVPCALFVPRA